MTGNQQKLYETAETQAGYFTYRQAIECGYSSPAHVYHVSTGAWLRECRGLYCRQGPGPRTAHWSLGGR